MGHDTLNKQDTDFTWLIGGPQPSHHEDNLVHHTPWFLEKSMGYPLPSLDPEVLRVSRPQPTC